MKPIDERLYQTAFEVAKAKIMKLRGQLSVSLFVNAVLVLVIFMMFLGMHK